MVSVLVVRSAKVWKATVGWVIDPVEHERSYVTLLARLDIENHSFLDFYLFKKIDRSKRFQISQRDPWLLRGKRLDDIAGFLCAALQVSPT